MKVLSLLQPWASLVAIDAKRFETRSWPCVDYRGALAIHASAGWKKTERATAMRQPFLTALEEGRFELDLYGVPRLPLGQILCVVDLVDCVPIEDADEAIRHRRALLGVMPRINERYFGDYSPGRFAWVLRDLRPLRAPIPAKGRLQLWNFPTEKIEAALA